MNSEVRSLKIPSPCGSWWVHLTSILECAAPCSFSKQYCLLCRTWLSTFCTLRLEYPLLLVLSSCCYCCCLVVVLLLDISLPFLLVASLLMLLAVSLLLDLWEKCTTEHRTLMLNGTKLFFSPVATFGFFGTHRLPFGCTIPIKFW